MQILCYCRYLKNIQCVDKNESFYYPVLWLSEVIAYVLLTQGHALQWHSQGMAEYGSCHTNLSNLAN